MWCCTERKVSRKFEVTWVKSSEVDADVWMKWDFKPKGDPYYNYMLCYVDDLLHIVFNPKEDPDDLNLIYRLKDGFDPPEQYLGANTEKAQLEDGRFFWSTNYVDCLNRKLGMLIIHLECIRRN